jgi:predicted acyl esterase
LVWSVTEKALEYVYDEAQKKVAGDLWQDETNAPQLMENAINEAVANVIYYTMTPLEIRALTE